MKENLGRHSKKSIELGGRTIEIIECDEALKAIDDTRKAAAPEDVPSILTNASNAISKVLNCSISDLNGIIALSSYPTGSHDQDIIGRQIIVREGKLKAITNLGLYKALDIYHEPLKSLIEKNPGMMYSRGRCIEPYYLLKEFKRILKDASHNEAEDQRPIIIPATDNWEKRTTGRARILDLLGIGIYEIQ